MKVITEYHAKNKLESSTYVPCARNITSGNLFANMGHINFKSVVVAATVDSAIVSATGTASTKMYESELPFGEVISLKGGASDTRVATVKGEDYLGNNMVETITLNGTTAVAGKKAFKRILSVSVPTASNAIELASTAQFGLPFQTSALIKVTKNGVVDSTITLEAFTHTQTATSNDPRGVVDLSSCSAGDEVEIIFAVTEYCTKVDGEDSEGGLFGVKPYAG